MSSRSILGNYSKDYVTNTPVRTVTADVAWFKMISGPVLANSLDQLQSNNNNNILTPLGLSLVLSSPYPIGNVAPNSGSFTTLTTSTPILSTSGGTGHNTYSQGEILIGNQDNTLNRLSTGSNGQVLTVNSRASLGVEWSSPDNNSSPLPLGFIQMSNPYPIFAPAGENAYVIYKIDSCYARSYDNSFDIKMNYPSLITRDNIIISGSLGIDAISTGTTVSGANIASNFMIGDIININSYGRRIIAIVDSNTLSIESEFDTDIITPSSYYRGGWAPNTTYYSYIWQDSTSDTNHGVFLSTRCYANAEHNNAVLDVSTNWRWRQIYPVFFTSALDVPNAQFVPCTYCDNRITSYWDPSNSENTSLYGSSGFSYDVPAGVWTDFSHFNPTQIPITMSMVYLQADTNVSIANDYGLMDQSMRIYPRDNTRFNYTGTGNNKVTFIGGIIDLLNVVGGN